MAADPARLAEARLYFVTDAKHRRARAARGARAGGVDVLQLREKDGVRRPRSSRRRRRSAALCARARRAVRRQRPARPRRRSAARTGCTWARTTSRWRPSASGWVTSSWSGCRPIRREQLAAGPRDGRRLRLRGTGVRDADQARLSGRRAGPGPPRRGDGDGRGSRSAGSTGRTSSEVAGGRRPPRRGRARDQATRPSRAPPPPGCAPRSRRRRAGVE